MDKEIAERWCTALRSGKYRQGTGTLRQVIEGRVTFCCLGVLTNLYLREHNESWTADGDDVDIGICELSDNEHLPLRVMEWSGMASECGARERVRNIVAPCLTELNDGSAKVPRLTFSEIADIIEKEAADL